MRFSLALTVALCLAAGGEARAHAVLKGSSPASGGSATASLSEIRLEFSEPIVTQFSGVSVTSAEGAPVSTGAPARDAADKKLLVVPLAQRLAPGSYKVDWHAVSVDTHRSKGSFSFTVAR